MIEMKGVNSGLYLKDGSLSKDKHVQEQGKMHEFLRDNGWKVEFAEGMDGAIDLFENYDLAASRLLNSSLSRYQFVIERL